MAIGRLRLGEQRFHLVGHDGAQHRLGARRSFSGAAGTTVLHGQPNASIGAGARWRSAHRSAPRPFSNLVPPFCCWPKEIAPRAAGRPAFPQVRSSIFRARQQGRDGSGAGLVSRARRDPHAARPDRVPTLYIWATPAALWAAGRRARWTSPHLTASRFSPASAISPPTRRRTASTIALSTRGHPVTICSEPAARKVVRGN